MSSFATESVSTPSSRLAAVTSASRSSSISSRSSCCAVPYSAMLSEVKRTPPQRAFTSARQRRCSADMEVDVSRSMNTSGSLMNARPLSWRRNTEFSMLLPAVPFRCNVRAYVAVVHLAECGCHGYTAAEYLCAARELTQQIHSVGHYLSARPVFSRQYTRRIQEIELQKSESPFAGDGAEHITKVFPHLLVVYIECV